VIRVCECGRAKENRGRSTRQWVSAIGEIPINRRYWQCRCSKVGSYLADQILGLEGRYSKVLQKHACRLSADTSFAAASEHLHELLGVKISAETIRELVESHGKSMSTFQAHDSQTAQEFAKAEGEVEFAVDAGKVHTREGGWKDLKIGVILKRLLGEPTSFEDWNSQRLPAASITLSFAMIAASATFRRSWRSRLKRLGVNAFASVHTLGDGASWIWKSVQRSLTGCVQTLDIYHASEHLHGCAERIFGEGTSATESAYERGRALLIRQGWSGICQWVSELLSESDETKRERRQQATTKLMNYFAKHCNRLNYAQMLAEGRVIGSGAVEGQAKTLGLRLKRRGARWNFKNVKSMASLVCVRNSTQWNSYWTNAV